jgi:serine protease Do
MPSTPNQPAQPRRQLPLNMQPQFKVTEVVTDSPADKAGVLKDDVIVSLNGKAFDMQTTLADAVKALKPGDAVTLTIKRGDKSQDIKVTLGENPDTKGVAYLGIRYTLDMSTMGGMMPALPNNRTPRGQGQQGMPFEMPAGMMQVAIAEVTKDSPADKAGLKAGDVISAANGTAISTPDALVKLVQAAKPGDKVTLSIVRDGTDDEIVVTLGENPDKAGAGYMGIALGAMMKFENMMPGQQGGMQMMPGFGGFPFQMPQEAPQQNDTQS